MVHLYPVPDAEGLARTKDLYLNRFGRTLSDAEAYEALSAVMRFLYLRGLPPDVLPEEPSLPGHPNIPCESGQALKALDADENQM